MSTQVVAGWSLEIVRGKDVGRAFALNGGSVVLGNALADAPGIDLADQEGTSPRRMAARQAELECSGQGLVLRDLESPGGTFVNRQRLLPGQSRPLLPGDVIQLGGVQLKVVTGKAASAPAPATKPPPRSPAREGPLPSPFTLATGATCRTWDDFLTVAAQRWPAMRDELVSGRLAAFLASVQRPDLAPDPQAPGAPDERLDAWLGSLPTTRPSRPELDVHPRVLNVRVVPGGGLTRQTLTVTNTGYRLLRSSLRVEPPAAGWLRVPTEFTRAPFVTVEQTEVPIELEIPETLGRPLSAALVIEGNGGSRRVEVRLERVTAPSVPHAVTPLPFESAELGALIARRPIGVRVVFGASAGLLLRVLLAVGGLVFAGGAADTLRGPLMLLAGLGGLVSALAARRRGGAADVLAAGFAGAIAGGLAAAVLVATSRSIEPRSLSTPLACLVWTALGAALAAASAWLIPFRGEDKT